MLAALATLLAASSSLPGGRPPPGFADPSDARVSDPPGAATPSVRPPPLPATTVPPRRKWNPLMDTLMDEFSVLNDARRANISALGVDKAKWEARQAETAQHLEALFYPLERNSTPPAYTVTGEIHHPSGFTMQKILYETRPGLFASGSLWVPDSAKAAGAKLPAVLLVSGHTSDGWRNNGRSLGDCTGPLDNCTGPDTNAGGGGVPHPHGPKSALGPFKGNPGGYQLALWNLVHKGFVALAFDPIGQGERLEYVRAGEVASKGHNWGTFEHEYLARQLFLAGRSAASFWVHDEMRSVDLMAALPFVDADNLGVCGCSGGGTQSSYLGSVDKRIKAASIACYMSTLETDYNYNYGGEYDGEQTWPRAAIYSLDKPDLVEVRAPKPTQILLTTEDNCFPFAGGQRAATEAQAAFNATGTPEALDVSISAYHHGWDNQNREAMYSFFLKHLGQSNRAAGSANGGGGGGGIVDSIEWWPDGFGNISGLFNASQLQVTSTGQVRTAPECAPNKIYHDFTQQIAAQKLAALQARRTDREAPQFFSYIRGVVAAVSGFRAPLEEPRPVAVGMVESPSWVKLAGEGQCMIEVLVTPPSVFNTAAGAAAVVLIGSDAGNFEPALLTNLTAAGHTVVEAKLCGFEKPHTAFPTSYKGMAAAPDIARNLNRSVVGIHAADILRVAAWVKLQLGAAPLATITTGQLHSAALHAALLSTDEDQSAATAVGALVLVGNTASYEAITTSLLYAQDAEWSFIFNVLEHYDLPDLSAALAEAGTTSQLIYGPVDALNRELNASAVAQCFAFADLTSKKAGGRAKFAATASRPQGLSATILEFISEQLT